MPGLTVNYLVRRSKKMQRGALQFMRYLTRIISAIIFLSFPLSANADEWNNYLKYKDRFYNLDKQEFNSISCNIDVPLINDLVKQMHAKFDSRKDRFKIKENAADFKLVYGKKEGLNIDSPKLDIKIISEGGMVDPDRVRKGIEMVKTGFNQAIKDTITTLQGFFEEIKIPKKGQFKIKEIHGSKAAYAAKYETDDSNITEIYSNNQRKLMRIFKNGSEVISVEDYKNIAGNKLLLTGIQTNIKDTASSIETNVTISYENIKGVLFPSRLEDHYKQSVQNVKQEGQIDIYLKNCTLR